jgi:HAD superfamily phosphoserine phosphatase-like hydrolase
MYTRAASLLAISSAGGYPLYGDLPVQLQVGSNPMPLPFDLIAFDVDGTLVDDTVFIWETLHDHFQTDPRLRKQAYEDYFSGRISYSDWFFNDIKLLKERGATRSAIEALIADMRLTGGVAETLDALRDAGVRLVIISGSLEAVIRHFKLAPWFEQIYLNRFEYAPDGALVGGTPTPYDVGEKATGLRHIARVAGVPMDRTAFVGDNFNDVSIAEAAGFSIAFNCKSDKLAEVADVEIEGGDLRRILPALIA